MTRIGDARLPLEFWRRVEASDAGCWLWVGAINRGGYGRFSQNARQRRAHRVAWEALVGPVPADQVLRHKCDTPHCVNVEHLELGTHKDNAQDCSRRGRAHGTGRGVNRLNAELVRRMRALAAEGIDRGAIASEIGTSERNVYYVLSGKTWAHVDQEDDPPAPVPS